ncbi:hypothetical protein BH11BAC3_BH11BAC3_22330 [soil metagenome]
MWALGELFYGFIYVLLALGFLIFLSASVFVKRRKIMYFVWSVVFASLFYIYHTNNKNTYKISQLQYVGSYDLTNYPNCDSCILIFKEDNTYNVTKNSKIIESGDWHYDFGADYFIVYINQEKERLGHGRFKYQNANNPFDKTTKH